MRPGFTSGFLLAASAIWSSLRCPLPHCAQLWHRHGPRERPGLAPQCPGLKRVFLHQLLLWQQNRMTPCTRAWRRSGANCSGWTNWSAKTTSLHWADIPWRPCVFLRASANRLARTCRSPPCLKPPRWGHWSSACAASARLPSAPRFKPRSKTRSKLRPTLPWSGHRLSPLTLIAATRAGCQSALPVPPAPSQRRASGRRWCESRRATRA